ncbi:MAG: hypothetical protein R2684_17295 [Pyrinomonadaceae bacterium]
MGGQACILYGGAEFSRDIDFAILSSDENLVQLGRCLEDLKAEVIAVPPFSKQFLERGHAIHFRCAVPEAFGLRIDVMTKMRELDDFHVLWERRTTIRMFDEYECHLLSLPDLVKAKKTQRDKDWPMIRRLLESHYFSNRDQANPDQIEFWLKEMRTPELLTEIVGIYPEIAQQIGSERPLLAHAISSDLDALDRALLEEERIERETDRAYWQPLRSELESLRHERFRKTE